MLDENIFSLAKSGILIRAVEGIVVLKNIRKDKIQGALTHHPCLYCDCIIASGIYWSAGEFYLSLLWIVFLYDNRLGLRNPIHLVRSFISDLRRKLVNERII